MSTQTIEQMTTHLAERTEAFARIECALDAIRTDLDEVMQHAASYDDLARRHSLELARLQVTLRHQTTIRSAITQRLRHVIGDNLGFDTPAAIEPNRRLDGVARDDARAAVQAAQTFFARQG